jgi:hypothetical protein
MLSLSPFTRERRAILMFFLAVVCAGGCNEKMEKADGTFTIHGVYGDHKLHVSHNQCKLLVLSRGASQAHFMICTDTPWSEYEDGKIDSGWGFMVDYNGPLAVGPCPRWGGDHAYFDASFPLWLKFGSTDRQFVITDINAEHKTISAHFEFNVTGYTNEAFNKPHPETTLCNGKMRGELYKVDYLIVAH